LKKNFTLFNFIEYHLMRISQECRTFKNYPFFKRLKEILNNKVIKLPDEEVNMTNEEEVVTLTFENAANESKKWQIVAVTGELLRDYVGRAAKQLFTPVPQRVGIATKDGAIVQNWSDKSVKEVIDTYRTNHYVIGTPDQLG